MGKLLPRAILFALLALLLIAGLAVVVLIAVIGLPDPRTGMGGFQQQAVAVAPTVDLAVGFLVMLLLGWLVGRPFVGRQAASAAGLMALLYILLDLAAIALLGNLGTQAFDKVALAYAVKIAGALIGGAIAGRSGAAATE